MVARSIAASGAGLVPHDTTSRTNARHAPARIDFAVRRTASIVAAVRRYLAKDTLVKQHGDSMTDTRTPPRLVTLDTSIGWIGTGVMGRSMCGHLLAKGHTVTVHTRTKTKAEGLLEQGASWAASPREVAERSHVVCTIVGFPRDVREV